MDSQRPQYYCRKLTLICNTEKYRVARRKIGPKIPLKALSFGFLKKHERETAIAITPIASPIAFHKNGRFRDA